MGIPNSNHSPGRTYIYMWWLVIITVISCYIYIIKKQTIMIHYAIASKPTINHGGQRVPNGLVPGDPRIALGLQVVMDIHGFGTTWGSPPICRKCMQIHGETHGKLMEMMFKLPNVSKCAFFIMFPHLCWNRTGGAMAQKVAITGAFSYSGRTKLGVVAGRRINPRIVGHSDIFG